MADQEYMRLSCGRCGVALSGARKKWCSTRCKEGTTMTREEYRQSVKDGAKGWFFCECCGKESFRRQSGTNKQQNYENRFCSMACRSAKSACVSREIDGIKRISGKQSAQARKRNASLASLARVLEKVRRIKDRAFSPCVVCGNDCGGGKTKPRLVCSKSCLRKTEKYQASRRKSESKRRAVERGCREARAIDPIKVFDRDGWKCQICLQPTPRKLRGTYKHNAPELDHIVPIAKGGAHVWSNLQCACRSCNAAKSDKSTAGQMGLFTALMQ